MTHEVILDLIMKHFVNDVNGVIDAGCSPLLVNRKSS